MFYQPSISTLVAAGGAKMPSTTVVRGGRLVNVVSAEIYSADIAIYENTIVATGDFSAYIGDDTEVIDAEGQYLVPGLFDGHQHIECSKLSITSAAKLLVPFGTTNVFPVLIRSWWWLASMVPKHSFANPSRHR